MRADGGGIAAVRPPPPFLQAAAAAAGPFGGKFGRCRSVWRQLAAAGPLKGRCTRPSFNGAAAVKCSLCCLQVLLFLLHGFEQKQKYYKIAN